jgi:magnesium chelatase family protein
MRPRLNPCPCGYFGDLKCANADVVNSRSSVIAREFPDRCSTASICTSKVRPWNTSTSRALALEEGSVAIRDRVGRARQRQQERFRSDKKVNCNARMGPRQIKQHCKLSDESQELIRVAMTELNLGARAYDRILKVSRTVADLQSSDEITTGHVSEAIQYRTFDRTLWV